MKIFKIVLSALTALACALLVFVWYSGFFSKVEIEKYQSGPYHIVYKEFIGSYSDLSFRLEQIKNDLVTYGIDEFVGFNMYLVDPQNKSENELRSYCGALIADRHLAKLDLILAKYNHMHLDKRLRLFVKFDYRNQFSIIAGTYKVYPAIEKYSKENGIEQQALYEFYDKGNNIIQYLMDLPLN